MPFIIIPFFVFPFVEVIAIELYDIYDRQNNDVKEPIYPGFTFDSPWTWAMAWIAESLVLIVYPLCVMCSRVKQRCIHG